GICRRPDAVSRSRHPAVGRGLHALEESATAEEWPSPRGPGEPGGRAVPSVRSPKMRLAPGMRLGPYEIVAPLGAGGMGEVWRAKDDRLGREVAIKVLPHDAAGDADRMRRFELEARSA